ncbi:hypothetical protein [Vibrio anguillarum]|uniref:hypothetical protein n=1 Tax=Vibrio anguillarum TaxID=55601 RepID=UPI001C9BF777|nr:hypothetical protein [Vibrio anguillarum]
MNFGSVLPSLFASTLLLSGCTLASDVTDNGGLYNHYVQYKDQIGSCMAMTLEGANAFPDSAWLRSLDEPKQKEVVVYLSKYSMQSCFDEKKRSFESMLSKESDDVQKIITEWLELNRKLPRPEGVDEHELMKLEAQIISPFNAFDVIETLLEKG